MSKLSGLRSGPGRPHLSRGAAFWGLAVTLGLMLFASSAPSPLYIVYQGEWNFSAITLTSVFAVYALALLATLVFAGSVSDQVGRRPALLVALAIELVAMVAFAEAQSVIWLFAARILQGIGTGIAMGAISAALLDLQPPDKPRLGALLGVAAPLTGLAAGALCTGLLVEYGPDPTRLVYWLLFSAIALAIPFAAAIPEPVQASGRWLQSLRPRIGVPPSLRVAFIATLPSLIAIWALGGLVLSHKPSFGAVVVEQTGRIAVNAHLLFDGAADDAIACPHRTVLVNEELGDDEQRYALGRIRRARQLGQNEMDDVFREVMLACRDENLGAGDRITAIGLRFGLGTNETQVSAALRLGQVHRARPFAADHLGKIHGLLLGRALGQQRRGGTMRQGRDTCRKPGWRSR